jgi:hypothetical protein
MGILMASGWWYTYPSEKWWTSSVGIMKFSTEWKNHPFMFQSPPTSCPIWPLFPYSHVVPIISSELIRLSSRTNQNYIKQRQQQIKGTCQPIKLPGVQTPGTKCALLPSWAARGLRLPYLVTKTRACHRKMMEHGPLIHNLPILVGGFNMF